MTAALTKANLRSWRFWRKSIIGCRLRRVAVWFGTVERCRASGLRWSAPPALEYWSMQTAGSARRFYFLADALLLGVDEGIVAEGAFARSISDARDRPAEPVRAVGPGEECRHSPWKTGQAIGDM